MKRIYLCGPVTGRIHYEAANHFKKIGIRLIRSSETSVDVSNPMVFCSSDLNWINAMKTCVRELITCHGIALLQGWQKSKGAAIELKLAQDLHIPVVFVETPLDFLGLNELFTAAPETLRYYNARLSQFHNEGMLESLAEERATAELANRYLDPYGFEYIEIEGA